MQASQTSEILMVSNSFLPRESVSSNILLCGTAMGVREGTGGDAGNGETHIVIAGFEERAANANKTEFVGEIGTYDSRLLRLWCQLT